MAMARTESSWYAMPMGDRAHLSDADLVRTSQYDRDALVNLYDRLVDSVYRSCNRRLPTDPAADAMRITFLNAMAAIPKMTPRQVERAHLRVDV